MFGRDIECVTVTPPRPPLRRTGRFFIGAALAALAVVVSAPRAGAQTPLEAVNGRFADVAPSRRSEPVLIPALANLEAPPIGVDRLPAARLLPYGAPGWDAAEAWATASPQRAMLEALREVTGEARYEEAKVFAQPYGVSDLSPSTIASGMYTDLGDPPLLAAARHLWLPAMERLRVLVHVEATRLTGEGDPAAAVDLVLRLVGFGRQMADRAMLAEVVWGYETMLDGLRRVRDVAYIDFKGGRVYDPDALLEVVGDLEAEDFLAISRLRFPVGNRHASRQLIDRVYEERGGAREDVFLSTMIRLSGGDRPFRRFAGASRWSGAAGRQIDWFDANDTLTEVYRGWTGRWDLDPFDPVMNLPFAIDTVESPRDAVVVLHPFRTRTETGREVTGTDLFELRTLLQVERIGTRLSLGVLGRYYVAGLFPPTISSIRPRWVRRIEGDPYNVDLVGDTQPPMEFFGPVRDAFVADRRDTPDPHTMEVFPGDGSNFEMTLFDDEFVLYSVGPNGAKDWAERVSQDRNALLGDYLIWPPVLGLHRVHLQQLGEFD